MGSGLLLCDIGNTALKIGLADNGKLTGAWAFPADVHSTADSLGMTLVSVLNYAGVAASALTACLISSVVPVLNSPLKAAVTKYCGCPTYFVPEDLPVPLENRYHAPAEVGADRLVGAYAARQKLPDPASLIVVDFGTAVTFDCIADNAYLGGLIFPGPATAASALAGKTARLPLAGLEVDCKDPGPCQDTATSIRHGLVFGYVCLVEGLCRLLARQLDKPLQIVATGGFATVLSPLVSVFDHILPDLVLEGLLLVYQNAFQTQVKPGNN